jgi:6-phosphogluconolactonase (cycloisomerase 2 family)
MCTSIDFGELPRLSVVSLAAIFATSGCGSGHSGSVVDQNNQYHYPSNSTGFAYVTSTGPTPGSAGAVYEYAVGVDGNLSPLAQLSIAAGINPTSLVVEGNGAYVYVVNAGDGTISQYAVANDATLTPLSPATVTNPGMHTLGTTGGSATVSPLGNYLYVANTADDNIAQFSIGSDGRLTPLAPATVATGAAPVSVVTSLVANSAGTSYYVLNSGTLGAAGSVSQYTQGADGTLTPTNSPPVAAGTNPSVIATGEFDTFAYVFNNCDGTQCLGSIRQFSVGMDGALTDTGNVVTTDPHTFGVGIAFEDQVNGSSGYVLTTAMGVDTQSSSLSSYQIGSSGVLVATNPPSQNTQGQAVALVETVQSGTLYVLTSNSGAVANMPATGGNMYIFAGLNGGPPTLLGTTALSAPYPTAMGAWVLLAP